MQKRVFGFIYFIILALGLFAAKSTLAGNKDSLLAALPKIKNDSMLSRAYNFLSQDYWYVNVDSAKYYANKALDLALGDRNYVNFSAALNNLGSIYCIQSNFDQSISYFLKGLQVDSMIQDSDAMSADFNNIAIIYTYRDNYAKALQYHFKALTIRRQLDDKDGVADSYNNIGMVYQYQKQYDLALKYYQKALVLHRILKHPPKVA